MRGLLWFSDGTPRVEIETSTRLTNKVVEIIAQDGTVAHEFYSADSIVGGNVVFTIDGNRAVLLTLRTLDFEEQDSHTITVQASDGEDTVSVLVTISVTDVGGEAPAPSLTLAFNQGTFTVSWSAVPGADKYRVRLKVGDAEWQNRPAVTGTSDSFTPEEIVCGSSFKFSAQSPGNGSAYPASWGSPGVPVGVTITCP